MSRRIATVPLGRLDEWRARPDASLLATRDNGRWEADILAFSCRSALLAFCRAGSALHALVKDPVPAPMFINGNTQRKV